MQRPSNLRIGDDTLETRPSRFQFVFAKAIYSERESPGERQPIRDASGTYFFTEGTTLVNVPSKKGIHVLPSSEISPFAVPLIRSADNSNGSRY